MNHCNEAHSVSYLTHRAMLFMYCKHVAVSIIYLIPGNDQLLLSANSCRNWNSAPVFLAIVSEGYSSLNLTKSGPYHVCSEKLKRFLPENSSCAAVFSAAATFRLASLCEAPLQVSSSATSFELREFNTVYSVLSHLWLTEAAGDNAKEAHTGLWHYRVQCLSGPDTEPLLRQYQQLLCADSSEGLHFPDIGGTNGKLTCRCVSVCVCMQV